MMKNGALRHEFLVGKRYGTKISATGGSVYALRPYPVKNLKSSLNNAFLGVVDKSSETQDADSLRTRSFYDSQLAGFETG
jgi:hypothetical protein